MAATVRQDISIVPRPIDPQHNAEVSRHDRHNLKPQSKPRPRPVAGELDVRPQITPMNSNIIYFGLAVALTAVFTAITCRWRIARMKRPSSGVVYGGAYGAAAVAVVFSIFHSVGARTCSLEFWTNPELPGVRAYLLQWALTGLACVVPAAFVAAKYRHKIRQ